MATESPEQIEEERRLFYVALTRAKDHLYVTVPQRYYFGRFRNDGHSYSQPSRFLTPAARQCFREVVAFPLAAGAEDEDSEESHDTRNVREGIRRNW